MNKTTKRDYYATVGPLFVSWTDMNTGALELREEPSKQTCLDKETCLWLQQMSLHGLKIFRVITYAESGHQSVELLYEN
jgi:hypothetical protein